MQNLILYNYFRSSTSYRVRIGLHLKNLSFDYKPVHLLKDGGQQHTPEYRKLNPQGEVPTLIHQGKAISQSIAILEYLDAIQASPRLFPTDPYQKAKILQACENINCGIHPITNLKVMQYLQQNLQVSEEQKKQWMQHWIHLGLKSFTANIETTSGKFCFGDQVTAADCVLIPQLFSARRFQVDVSSYPLLLAIEKNSETIEAFEKAHPKNQPDFES